MPACLFFHAESNWATGWCFTWNPCLTASLPLYSLSAAQCLNFLRGSRLDGWNVEMLCFPRCGPVSLAFYDQNLRFWMIYWPSEHRCDQLVFGPILFPCTWGGLEWHYKILYINLKRKRVQQKDSFWKTCWCVCARNLESYLQIWMKVRCFQFQRKSFSRR